MKQTAINERIFIEIEIGVREGKVMATGPERGSSADVTLRWKKVMQAVGFAGYLAEQSFVTRHTETLHILLSEVGRAGEVARTLHALITQVPVKAKASAIINNNKEMLTFSVAAYW